MKPWQVCSLEWARKLKELGVAQESAFYWDNIISLDMEEGAASLWRVGDVISWGMEESYDGPSDHALAAFTVAELGVLLGEHVFSEYEHDLSMPWKCTFDEGYMKPKRFEYSDTESDARAKMLYCLLENGIITVDEVNKRLREAS